VRPYLEKLHHNKRAGGAAQGVDPEFKPQYHKKKKKGKKKVLGGRRGSRRPLPGLVLCPELR
jgi:hypothetical protein